MIVVSRDHRHTIQEEAVSTRSLTVTAVAAAVLAIGGGTALAMGAGADQPTGTMTLASGQQQPTASPSPAAPAAPPAGTTIDRGTAERTALQVAGGGVVTKSELDDRDDDGDPREWEIDVRNGATLHEIEMNAATGEVTSLDHERGDDRRGVRVDDRDDRGGDDNGGTRVGDDRGVHHQGDDDRFDDHGGDRGHRGDD